MKQIITITSHKTAIQIISDNKNTEIQMITCDTQKYDNDSRNTYVNTNDNSHTQNTFDKRQTEIYKCFQAIDIKKRIKSNALQNKI